jgi:hypothetical protein
MKVSCNRLFPVMNFTHISTTVSRSMKVSCNCLFPIMNFTHISTTVSRSMKVFVSCNRLSSNEVGP